MGGTGSVTGFRQRGCARLRRRTRMPGPVRAQLRSRAEIVLSVLAMSSTIRRTRGLGQLRSLARTSETAWSVGPSSRPAVGPGRQRPSRHRPDRRCRGAPRPVRTSVDFSGARRSRGRSALRAPVAQWTERPASTRLVGGSTPSGRAEQAFDLRRCGTTNRQDASTPRKPPGLGHGIPLKAPQPHELSCSCARGRSSQSSRHPRDPSSPPLRRWTGPTHQSDSRPCGQCVRRRPWVARFVQHLTEDARDVTPVADLGPVGKARTASPHLPVRSAGPRWRVRGGPLPAHARGQRLVRPDGWHG